MKAELVRVTAGDGLELVGLYAAPPGKAARRAVLHTHGLAGNFYENRFIGDVCDAVLAKGVAFLATNNRGHDYRSDNLKGRGAETTYLPGGATLDIIEDCVHDLSGGAAFLAERGHEDIYFEGHSLGCSKIVYYISEVGHPSCAGLILISPPEMFGLQQDRGEVSLEAALAQAMALVSEGQAATWRSTSGGTFRTPRRRSSACSGTRQPRTSSRSGWAPRETTGGWRPSRARYSRPTATWKRP